MILFLKTKRQKIISAIIVFLIIFDIFISGFMKFGYYIVKCGGMPVAIDSSDIIHESIVKKEDA